MSTHIDDRPNSSRLRRAFDRAAAVLSDAEKRTSMMVSEVRGSLKAAVIEPEYADNKFASRIAQGMAKHRKENR